jgi:hypothetical protein
VPNVWYMDFELGPVLGPDSELDLAVKNGRGVHTFVGSTNPN